MRILLPIITFSILYFTPGCVNANKPKDTNESLSVNQSIPDTIIYSSPANYSLNMENFGDSGKMFIESYKEVLDLFEKLNYTPESWQAGIREIPRVYFTTIGERWGSKTTSEITILQKKQLFFRGIAPLILRSNELIEIDRVHLERIRSSFLNKNPLSDEENKWVLKLADLYKVQVPEGKISAAEIERLWEKVDVIPPSLALAQAAEESAWGTSRFAEAGNAIYGQWSWGKNAIKPRQQREELGNYGIAAFGSLQESVQAYMLNLNTHNAYSDLRNIRAKLRQNGEKPTGSILADGLLRYSERGEDYVKSLKSLMDYNKLSPADDAFLLDDDPVYLLPANPMTH